MAAPYCDCSASDFDADRCCQMVVRTARKPHTCIECGATVEPGKRYEEASGISHDGDPYRYHTCLPCSNIRKHYCPHGWIWGWLAELIEECIGWDYRLPASEIPDEE